MKDLTPAILFFGSLSVFGCAISLVASCITYAPSIAATANGFMTATTAVTAGAMLTTLLLLIRRGRSFVR